MGALRGGSIAVLVVMDHYLREEDKAAAAEAGRTLLAAAGDVPSRQRLRGKLSVLFSVRAFEPSPFAGIPHAAKLSKEPSPLEIIKNVQKLSPRGFWCWAGIASAGEGRVQISLNGDAVSSADSRWEHAGRDGALSISVSTLASACAGTVLIPPRLAMSFSSSPSISGRTRTTR
jgi:hypothetical protein